ncbi:hypothetical protein GWI33_009241 [Rhynchophorus ferrugineus]|uniref:Uncharacterized protein n=1 Tax=Rhynchophorus ferrugineus TaxID=354439 RepID=A0A834IGZ8_RHYFE|nr:hypothetical protein GWI33_009241 [Rhynchophorus ferrugineus]
MPEDKHMPVRSSTIDLIILFGALIDGTKAVTDTRRIFSCVCLTVQQIHLNKSAGPIAGSGAIWEPN